MTAREALELTQKALLGDPDKIHFLRTDWENTIRAAASEGERTCSVPVPGDIREVDRKATIALLEQDGFEVLFQEGRLKISW